MSRYWPLAVIGLALAGLAAIAVLVLAPHTQPQAAPLAAPATATASPELVGSDADTDTGDPGTAEERQAQWLPLVTRFARAFTNPTGGHRAWANRLLGDPDQPTITPALAAKLRTVDTANLPGGKVDSITFLDATQWTAAAKVTYTTGWSMVVTVTTSDIDWQISGYDRLDEN